MPLHYHKRIQCENCDRVAEHSIPKGQSAEKFAENTTCGYCGCKLLSSEEPYYCPPPEEPQPCVTPYVPYWPHYYPYYDPCSITTYWC